ncbi:hypothetical protein AVEN_64427-1 [Araneus ventricosus]|uniref:Integrase catalytic domain-containing protein n=1 Tax=Araneus ventricosus TaxID=182803 RepID=A0A4Y2QI27_ARAVE|nr:hypothetical protein AVEN_49632-1 [Araneus ventricosus]GBN62944.1 hypothetical protein AVEN_64427-1 [Araneus ventricosus]
MTVVEASLQNWIFRFGTPFQLHSDQGRNFISAVCKGLFQFLQVDKTQTTALHPQSDGMCPPDTPSSLEDCVQDLQARLDDVHNFARGRINIATEKMKTRYDTRTTGHE